ncbi:MAG: cytochrome c3 family protein, partial [Chloroflexota bacterium]|nr:cytochrome c3 family protein [Chloroflexota bacterium]
MKIYAIVAAVLLAIFLTISPASADNDLHDKDALMAEADGCAGCHRAHTAQGPKLLKEGATQDQFCFTCHDGTGAETDVVNGVLVGQPNPPGTDPTQYGNGDDGDGNPLRGGGFVYATMDTDADGVLEVGVEVTSTHSASGAVSGTMWGSGPINGGESDYGITVELKCADCHNPHGNGNYRILRGNPDGMEDEGNTTAVDVADEITKNYEVTFIAGNG